MEGVYGERRREIPTIAWNFTIVSITQSDKHP